MKTAIVASVSATSFEALAFSADLDAAFAAASDEEFDAVEIAVRDPALVDPKKIRALASDHRLAIAAIGTGQAFVEEGLSLSSTDPERRNGAIARLKAQIGLSCELGAQVIIGLIRGTSPKKNDPAALDRLRAALAEVGEHALKQNSPGLLLEPINRYETKLLNSVPETLEFLDSISGLPVKVLADTYHMNIEDRDLHDSIKLAGGRLGHVHFADSNRHAPGQGHINFDRVFQALEEIGYGGFLSAEILPEPSPREAVRLAGSFFRRKRLGI